jgi:hypothetical protein
MEVAVRTRETRLDGGGSQNQGNKARWRWQSEPGNQG